MEITRKSHAVALRHAVAIAIWAFLFAGITGLASQAGAERIDIFAAGLALLAVIIVVGVLFDIVGVAATAAQEAPLNARAAHQVFGATHAVRLVRNAHQVASICNDVVGDVSGTLSGAIGVTLVLKMLEQPSESAIVLSTTLMTASIAALVVGGKAYGKVIAIEQGTEIMFRVGQLLAWVDRLLPFDLLPAAKHRNGKMQLR
jgi:CBS domain containing-hemolysin-like protein